MDDENDGTLEIVRDEKGQMTKAVIRNNRLAAAERRIGLLEELVDSLLKSRLDELERRQGLEAARERLRAAEAAETRSSPAYRLQEFRKRKTLLRG